MNLTYIYFAIGSGILALLFALYKSTWVNRQDPGNSKIKEIGAAIRQGAMAFLSREYRVLGVFVLSVAVLLFIGYKDNLKWVAASFIVGAFSSALAGYFGMRIATAANMQFVIGEIADQFEAKHEVQCQVILGSSGKLTAQIEQGAPFDIFLSADEKYAQYLDERQLTVSEPSTYAYGKLIIWCFEF